MNDTYVVATSPHPIGGADKRLPCWDPKYVGAKLSPEGMRQVRQANPGQRVRMFTTEQWDAMPNGAHDGDWVWTFNRATLRYPQGRPEGA